MEPSMSRNDALAAALALGLPAQAVLPALAAAQTVDATAVTSLTGRSDPRDGTVHTIVPAYENIWIAARDLAVDGVADTRVIVAGWAMVDGGDPAGGDRFTGDLDLAFVEGKIFDRRVSLRAGRQLVLGGVARNL